MVPSGLFTLVILPLVLLLGAAVALVVGRRRARTLSLDDELYPGLRTLRLATVRYRLLGLGLGLGVGVVTLPLGRLQPAFFAAPLIAASAVVAAIILGQQSAYRAARVVGSAGLERRQLRSYLPAGLTRSVAGLLALLVAATLFTTLAASPDDMGRAGRAVAAWWMEGEGVESAMRGSQRGPFPGSFYTLWLGVALVLLLALAATGLALTVRRPRNGADPVLVRVDDALRRITVEGIVAAVGVGVGGAAFAVTLVAGMQLVSLAPVPVTTASGVITLVGALIALLGFFAAAVVLLVPRDGGAR